MHRFVALLVACIGFSAPLYAQSCPAGTTTSISGVVYAPNGTDPLPNVTVYVPTTAVDAFTPGVSCPVQNAAPSGNPTVGTTTAVDGSFSIADVPVGAAVPLVIVSGRWRRQITVDTTAQACGNTVVDPALSHFPKNQTEGDIPKFAIATGSVDQVECVLRKVGLDAGEFTNPSGSGRIHLYQGDGSALAKSLPVRSSGGAIIDSSTPAESALMGDISVLSAYDVLMLPCEGGDFTRPSTQLQNLVSFANAGGRVYSSHYAYSWMWQNPPFNTVATWNGRSGSSITSGTGYVNTGFAEGKTLYDWLQLPAINASPTPGQITLNTIRQDFNSINTAVNQSWLTLNSPTGPVMQFVFDTPVAQTTGQCGRVLFNEYHVENGASNNLVFPSECSTAAMTPQEKLLEYSLFELTTSGGAGSLAPTSADFGSVPIGFSSAAQKFTWTNNSTFQATVSLVATTGDFAVNSNGCSGSIKSGASCDILVSFSPTALGARTGTLSVGSGAQTLTADLTGTGIPGLTVSPTTLDFGSVDVGASLTRTVTITNSASGGIPMPALTTTGDFSSTTNCAATVPANSNCTVSITFKPTQSGSRTGTTAATNIANPAYSQISVALTGNGLDFTIAMNPASGTVIAGYVASTTSTVSPLAGFAAPVTMTCTTNAPGSTCSLSATSITPSSPVTVKISITTTSTYTVVGYGGMGSGLLLLIAVGSGWMLTQRRKQASTLLRVSAAFLLLTACGFAVTGCGGKAPAQNASPTVPGSYTYTVTATDGIITHSATYGLNVTVR